MKKCKLVVSILMCTLFLASSAFAQQSGWGIKGGVNFAKFNGDDVSVEQKSYSPYSIGTSYTHNQSKDLDIETDILITQVGSSYSVSGLGNYKHILTYIKVPVLFKYGMSEDISIYGGPYVAYLMSSIIDGPFGDSNNKKDTKKLDFGLVIGADYNVDIFKIGLRYSQGLTTVDEDSKSDVRNSVFSFLFGYQL